MKANNVLVLGLGISGVSTIKLLDKIKKNIYLYDKKSEIELKDNLEKISNIKVEKFLNGEIPDLSSIDLVVKSPGMKLSEDIIQLIKKENIELVTDIELAYRLSNTKNIVAVTGTNGKTTVVTLLNEIFENDNKNVFLGGNIGYGILDHILETKKDDILLIEASSFQLNDIIMFKPMVSAIINLGSDHLDWHNTTEQYQQAKRNIYRNQGEEDFIVLDYDSEVLRNLDDIKAKVIWCSTEEVLNEGIYIENDKIVIKQQGNMTNVMDIKDIKLYGKHNLKNILYVVGMCHIMGINLKVVRETITDFRGVEHRLEYVDTISNVKFINDSKGTNIESTIVAIDAFDEPKILIAGGKDEGACFVDLAKKIEQSVKYVVLFGETKDLINNELMKIGYRNITLVNSLNDAVKEAAGKADMKDVILFSPACASYDMYNNYMERGEDFKSIIKLLKEV